MAIWGHTADGTAVPIYTLTGGQIEVRVTAYGAHLVSVKSPGPQRARWRMWCLGFDSLEGYLKRRIPTWARWWAATAIASRWASLRSTAKTYQIPVNNGPNALHGGPKGFDQYVWKSQEVPDGVEFTHVSPDGDMGFPGTLTATGALHAQGQHAAHRLHGHHRQADGGEPDQPLVLQPAWRRPGQHSRPED